MMKDKQLRELILMDCQKFQAIEISFSKI